MRNIFPLLFLFRTGTRILLAIILLGTIGCGGAGSNDSQGQTGNFTLTIGDDALANFDQAIFDISSITLIGDDVGHVLVLDEMRSIDFLALETINEVLAELAIPVGHYSKIRLQVDNIALIERDNQSAIVNQVEPRLIANGKIDVLIKGGFFVTPNNDTILAIDIDLNKSIKLIQNGVGQYHFRPVIFAKLLNAFDSGRLIRFAGEFERIEESNLSFSLCDTDLLSDNDQIAEFFGCRTILLQQDTGVFVAGINGIVPAVISDINNGEQVVVYGHLTRLESNLNEEQNHKLSLQAVVVASGTFQKLEGTATTDFMEVDETFTQLLDEGQGVAGNLAILTHLPLSQHSALFDNHGNPVDFSAIANGVAIETEGLLLLNSVNSLDAFITIVKTPSSTVFIEGSLQSRNLVERSLVIMDDNAVTHCVTITNETVIQQLLVIGDTVTTETIIDISFLSSGRFEVSGTANSDGNCTNANVILVQPAGL